VPARNGLGRVGRLTEPVPFAAFVDRVVRALPATAAGVRAAGDPGRPVGSVAVCGGAGDSLLAAAVASGADAYVTADLRHHRASEAIEPGPGTPPALVDVSHWASEWPWLPVLAHELAAALAPEADRAPGSVQLRVSDRCTDPWSAHRSCDEGSQP
jgi:putative NIF3 family GTP cyclohydrolase 1 type 2